MFFKNKASEVAKSAQWNADFHTAVKEEVAKQVAYQKAFAEYNAAPTYKVATKYSIEKHKDVFFLQVKLFTSAWSENGPGHKTVYNTIFSGSKKDVYLRYNRLTSKKSIAA